MSKCTLVKFIDPSDDSETFAQFNEDRTAIAIYSSESTARRWLGCEIGFDLLADIRNIGGEAYNAAVDAALEGEIVATA